MILRRHVIRGAVCGASYCLQAHHYPKHRRSGPQNTEITSYVGRHRAPVSAE